MKANFSLLYEWLYSVSQDGNKHVSVAKQQAFIEKLVMAFMCWPMACYIVCQWALQMQNGELSHWTQITNFYNGLFY